MLFLCARLFLLLKPLSNSSLKFLSQVPLLRLTPFMLPFKPLFMTLLFP